MADQTKSSELWTPRSVEDTKRIYADWADTYEDDVTGMAYATPDRIALALVDQNVDLTQPVLDFGCGTGLSGAALRRHGFSKVDGTDISVEMMGHAQAKTLDGQPLYRQLWLGDAKIFSVKTGDYGIIVATGVISLGAAGPDMLGELLGALSTGGLLAFSYNDPTLADRSYTDALDNVLSDGTATLVHRAHGPHLNSKVTGSDVIILRRS
ncbi:methyltransferase domain-containing protein [Octadecabacter sp. G9-8]|uniref:Methyltransferase domain-containing protein n=1 Tax=Octadecabacter dasysiphoniae TaxID=2909341 RepID=A0ABS9CWR0_9RHOB|nr:methyltransferase domain-containing protein [Octadecabacter dasysiphoniae]MCF2870601.1 methyltransferase domain-containing protein [Octadecabacter dasysiphoniae]